MLNQPDFFLLLLMTDAEGLSLENAENICDFFNLHVDGSK